MKKLLLLSDCNSVHTYKWYKSLYPSMRVKIFSFSDYVGDDPDYSKQIVSNGVNHPKIRSINPLFKLFLYVKSITRLKTIIREYRPDIVHAHYATSYGLIGALVKDAPFVMSVWGSDILIFPKKSWIHKNFLRWILRKADVIQATSHYLKNELLNLFPVIKVSVVPFGVETDVFVPDHSAEEGMVFGIAKSLEKIYGIDKILQAIKILAKRRGTIDFKFLVAGSGSEEEALRRSAKSLKIDGCVTFLGRLKQSEMVKFHNRCVVEIYPSLSESFGVSVLEAFSCGNPVIVSNAGGLSELVENDVTGIVLKKNDPQNIADAMNFFLDNRIIIRDMGSKGLEMVRRMYSFSACREMQLSVYEKITSGR